MRYRIVHATSASKLEVEVNRMIEYGWQPIGGVDSSRQGMSTYYHQAMIYWTAPKHPEASG
jgi:hypothetical protein